MAGASLWNNMHKDMTQYRPRKCFKGELRKQYIAKYHVWCIDWCLFLSVFDTYLSLLERNIALFHSELSWHFLYRPGYHLIFYLVVSKMGLVLSWEPPADNNVCFCLVRNVICISVGKWKYSTIRINVGSLSVMGSSVILVRKVTYGRKCCARIIAHNHKLV